MKLHDHEETFHELVAFTSGYKKIPERAVVRDYFITMVLLNLSSSPFKLQCVLKGGTSLSKCHGDSIRRFSEDIDLSVTHPIRLGKKKISDHLKFIETTLSEGFQTQIESENRNFRNKSSFLWKEEEENRIKLEIGFVDEHPDHSLQITKSYIQEYLEHRGLHEDAALYDLHSFEILAQDIHITFWEKLFALKHHAFERSLPRQVRHIHDVVTLYRHFRELIFSGKDELDKKTIQRVKKTTDSYYAKRSIERTIKMVDP